MRNLSDRGGARVFLFAPDVAGGVATEFALVLPMLIVFVVGVMEIGFIGMISNSLDNSMITAARTIRTGQTNGPTDGSSFRDMICAQLPVSTADCQARLSYSVQRFSDFASAQAASSGALSGQFNKGAPGDVILVHATYQLSLVPFGLAPLPTTVLLDARTTFKNEPYA